MRPNVTDKYKLYLLRTTSSPEVRSFLDWQPANTKTDYQLLQKALIKEFANPESDQGLVAALETRQGRHEPPKEPSFGHKPPSWLSRMSMSNEHSAVARLGAESLRQTKDGFSNERQNSSSS